MIARHKAFGFLVGELRDLDLLWRRKADVPLEVLVASPREGVSEGAAAAAVHPASRAHHTSWIAWALALVLVLLTGFGAILAMRRRSSPVSRTS